MSKLIRWQPMGETVTLRGAMRRFFDEAFTRPWSMADGLINRIARAVDLFETQNGVVVKAALPGIKADDVDINVTREMLTIKGDFRAETESKDKAYRIREHRWGRFERSMGLPTGVVSEKAKAEFEDGVLTVTLPKADGVKPETISVKAK